MAPQCPRGGNYSRHATILLVGASGSGKRTLGKIAANALGRPFFDLDEHVAAMHSHHDRGEGSSHGTSGPVRRPSPKDYAEAMMHILARYPRHAVISCGNHIIESSECQAILPSARSFHPIVCILRDNNAAANASNANTTTPQSATIEDQDIEAARHKKEQVERIFIWCASHCFFNADCDVLINWHDQAQERRSKAQEYQDHPLLFKSVADSFLRLIRQIIGIVRPEKRTELYDETCEAHQQAQGSYEHRHGQTKLICPWLQPTVHSKVQSEQYPSLPCRADVTSRSSLLTRRTMVLSLTFADLKQIQPDLMEEMTQGVDAIELRADFLACITPLTRMARESRILETPQYSVKAVVEQLELLRRLAPGIPILFTLRSTREGGHFFDDRNLAARETASPHSQAIYFRLLEIAIATGVEMIDVELGWDPSMTRRVIDARGRTKVVMSYHDLTGALKWDSPLPHQLYERAQGFGNGIHLVHIFSTTTTQTVGQNAHLASTVIKMNLNASKDAHFRLPPIMAINMGRPGQWTRTFNDVMNFITHPAIPIKAGAGQMTLPALFETSYRLGTIQRSRYHLWPSADLDTMTRAIASAFEEYAFPADVCEWDARSIPLADYVATNRVDQRQERHEDLAANPMLSNGLFLPLDYLQQRRLYNLLGDDGGRRVSLPARVVGAVDALAREDCAPALLGTEGATSPPSALSELHAPMIGCHTLPAAIYRVLRRYLAPHNAPTPERAALIVVLEDEEEHDHCDQHPDFATDTAKRAAFFGVSKLGFGKVYVCADSTHATSGREMNWIEDVANLIQRSADDVLEQMPDEVGDLPVQAAALPYMPKIDIISHLGELKDNVRGDNDDRYAGEHGTSSDSLHGTVMWAQRRRSRQPPCAVVLVGGTLEKQQEYLVTLRKRSAAPSKSKDEVLSQFLLESHTGGTLLCVPSRRKDPFGTSGPRNNFTVDELERRDQVVAHPDEIVQGASGWIIVHPCAVERDRIQRGVIEAWMRRSAPDTKISKAWCS